MRTDPTFTAEETRAIELAGETMGALRRVASANIAEGRSPVEDDLREAAAAVHVLQSMAMSSAAARANPGLVRPFGASFLDPAEEACR